METKTSNPSTVSGITLEPSTESEKKPWSKPKLHDLQATDTEAKPFNHTTEAHPILTGPS